MDRTRAVYGRLGLIRGDIVTVAPPGEFGKPRPALIVQSDLALPASTCTYLLITSDLRMLSDVRIPIQPSTTNGLLKPSEIMVDLIQTSTLSRFGKVVGHVDKATLRAVETALAIFLGLG